ncbi:MAG: hypothetical protein LUH02_10400 [Erysipelotrichaceae bacterium]|nr:hypothetical protein [Erysipelotrichaceae bacterium]
MSFKWSTNDISTMTLTIYETNLTLNKAASVHFEDVNFVLLGIDEEARQIGIKPISKEEIDEHIYNESQLHRFSHGKSYGRISNKSFVKDLSNAFGLKFDDNQCYKYTVTFDVVHSIMVAQL